MPSDGKQKVKAAATAAVAASRFQARTGAGSAMFTHELDFDEGNSSTHFYDRGLASATASVVNGRREEELLVLSSYMTICGKLTGAHRFALNDTMQALNAAPLSTMQKSDFWVHRQQVVKQLVAAVFPSVQRLLSPASGTDGDDVAASKVAGFAVYAGPDARETGRVASVGDESTSPNLLRWAQRVYLDASTGVALHVWQCPVAARAFTTSMTRMWQAVAENRMNLGGLVSVPVVALVCYRGLFVTAMPLVPISPADPATLTGTDPDIQLQSAVGLAAAATSFVADLQFQQQGTLAAHRAATSTLRGFAASSPSAKLLYEHTRGFLLRGRDGRFYLFCRPCPPSLSVPPVEGSEKQSAAGPRVVPLRPEALGVMRQASMKVPSQARPSKQTRLAEAEPEELGQVMRQGVVPLAVHAMRADLEKLVATGGAKVDGGLQLVLTKLATSDLFVLRGLRHFGVNVAFLGHCVAEVESIAKAENATLPPVGQPRGLSTSSTETDVSADILATLRDACVYEMAVRCVKHVVRGELYALQDKDSVSVTSDTLVAHVHRVMALAANDHKGFWKQLNDLAAAKFGIAAQIPFSLQLVKVLTWHLTPKYGLAFEQANGCFASKFACVSAGNALLPVSDLMRLIASGGSAAVAEFITREWDALAVGSPDLVPPHMLSNARRLNPADANLAKQASTNGKFEELEAAALGAAGDACIPISVVPSQDGADAAFRLAALCRVAMLELLVRWTNKQTARLNSLRDTLLGVMQDASGAGAGVARDTLLTALVADLADTADKRKSADLAVGAHADAVDALAAGARRALNDHPADAEFALVFAAMRRRTLALADANLPLARTALSMVTPTERTNDGKPRWGLMEPSSSSMGAMLPSFTIRTVHAVANDVLDAAAAQASNPTPAADQWSSVVSAAVEAVKTIGDVAATAMPGGPSAAELHAGAFAKVFAILSAAQLTKRPRPVEQTALDPLVAWLLPIIDGSVPMSDGPLSDKVRGQVATCHGLLTLATVTSPQLLADAEVAPLASELQDLRASLTSAAAKDNLKAVAESTEHAGQVDALLSVLLAPPGGNTATGVPANGLPRTTPLRVRVALGLTRSLQASGKIPRGSGSAQFAAGYEKAASTLCRWFWRVAVRKTVLRPALADMLRIGTSGKGAPVDDSLLVLHRLVMRRVSSGDATVAPLVERSRAAFVSLALDGGYMRGMFVVAFEIVLPRLAITFTAEEETLVRAALVAEESHEFVADILAPHFAANASGARQAVAAQEASERARLEELQWVTDVAELRGRGWIELEEAAAFDAVLRCAPELHCAAARYSTWAEWLAESATIAFEFEFAITVATVETEKANFGVAAVARAEQRGRDALEVEAITELEETARGHLECVAGETLSAAYGDAAEALLLASEVDGRVAVGRTEMTEREGILRHHVDELESSQRREMRVASDDVLASFRLQLQETAARGVVECAWRAQFLDPGVDEWGEPVLSASLWTAQDLSRRSIEMVAEAAARSLFEHHEGLCRQAVEETEANTRAAFMLEHLRHTLHIALERCQQAEGAARGDLAEEEARGRLELVTKQEHGARLGIVRAFDEVFMASMQAAERSVRAAAIAEGLRGRTAAIVDAAALSLPLVVSAGEHEARRILLWKQCHHQRRVMLWEQVRGPTAALLEEHGEPLARQAVAEAEDKRRHHLRARLEGACAATMAKGLLRTVQRAHAKLAKEEAQERATLMLAAHHDVARRLWTSRHRALVDFGLLAEESRRDAIERAEMRVLQSEFKLLVIAFRQQAMAQEHAAFRSLRDLRDLYASERETRANVEVREEQEREELRVKEAVWRLDLTGGAAHAADGVESPFRKRAMARIPPNPHADKHRAEYEARQKRLAKPHKDHTEPLPWQQQSFTPPPLVRRTFDEQRKRAASLSPIPGGPGASAERRPGRRPARLKEVLDASRQHANSSPAQSSPRRIAARAAADVEADLDERAAFECDEQDERESCVAAERSERRALLAAWTPLLQHGTRGAAEQLKVTKPMRAYAKALETEEGKRREAIEFEYERETALLAVSRREAIAGPAPPRAMPGTAIANGAPARHIRGMSDKPPANRRLRPLAPARQQQL